MASSLLDAIGLPELITDSYEAYEARAIDLARTPEGISRITSRLKKNRDTCPLFDTALFAKHIEDAYAQMYERHHSGLLPDHIFVRR